MHTFWPDIVSQWVCGWLFDFILMSIQKQSLKDQQDQSGKTCQINHLRIPNDGTNVWEIDPQFLTLDHKFASGSYGDL